MLHVLGGFLRSDLWWLGPNYRMPGVRGGAFLRRRGSCVRTRTRTRTRTDVQRGSKLDYKLSMRYEWRCR